jgi:hypothetical protein
MKYLITLVLASVLAATELTVTQQNDIRKLQVDSLQLAVEFQNKIIQTESLNKQLAEVRERLIAENKKLSDAIAKVCATPKIFNTKDMTCQDPPKEAEPSGTNK